MRPHELLKGTYMLYIFVFHYLHLYTSLTGTLCSQFSSKIRIELIPSRVEESTNCVLGKGGRLGTFA